jgi:DNA primase
VLRSDAPGGKYVNSPETPLFTKGNVLFGLDKTKRALITARSAIVCEGQLDLIRAYESGVQNVIAPQGTAFTPRQAAILKRYVEEAILCFDADSAGRTAAERAAPSLFEAGLSVRVARMPAGEDPDSLIRKHGADAFRDAVSQAVDFYDFLIEVAAREHDLQSHRGRTRFAAVLAEAIAPIKDPVMRESVIGRAAVQISVAPDVLRRMAADVRTQPVREIASQKTAPAPLPRPSLALSQLLRAALQSAETFEWLRAQPDRDFLKEIPGGEFLSRILAGDFRPGDTPSITAYLTTWPAEEEALISEILSAPLPHDPADACWDRLREQWIKDRLKLVRNQIQQPGLSPEALLGLQKEILDLKKQLTEIARPRI